MPTGAGSGSGAGVVPAGFDPLPSTPRPKVLQIDPVLFDLGSRNIPRDPVTGLLLTIHWVDQWVALALGVTQGSFASQTSLGNRLRFIKRAGGPTVVAQVTDAIRVALLPALNRGDISVTKINVDTSFRGRIVVELDYINQRLTPVDTTNMKLVF